MYQLPKSFIKIVNRYNHEDDLASISHKDSIVIVATIARHRTLNDDDKMSLIRGYCQCLYTLYQIKEELQNR